MRPSRPVLSAVAVAVAASACTVALAPAGQAATAPRVVSLHVAASTVGGNLPAGAGVSVISSCPAGTDLERALFGRGDEDHDPRLRLVSREYWPAGEVARYRVVTALRSADAPAVVVSAVACRLHPRRSATSVSGTAATDLRVWGPAPAQVALATGALTAVGEVGDPGRALRAAVRAAGTGSSKGSLRGAVRAIQTVVADQDGTVVLSVGATTRTVKRGTFASLVNRYAFRAAL